VATKTPSKGKKSASKDSAPKKSAKPKAPPPNEADEADESEAKSAADDEDERPAPAAKRPAARGRAGGEVESPPVVPARRLTPEAKARVNEMVQKGVPLGEALRIAASWETFVAPVKEEPAKLVQGKSFDSPRPRREEEDEDEEPATSSDSDD
jgi:hypothetical protein